ATSSKYGLRRNSVSFPWSRSRRRSRPSVRRMIWWPWQPASPVEHHLPRCWIWKVCAAWLTLCATKQSGLRASTRSRSRTVKRRSRVIWTKGMFLSPQHFQSQDLYFEDLIHFRFRASHFANYGVTKLEVDTDALSNGLFRIVAARGLMPDGEVFDMPNPDELP